MVLFWCVIKFFPINQKISYISMFISKHDLMLNFPFIIHCVSPDMTSMVVRKQVLFSFAIKRYLVGTHWPQWGNSNEYPQNMFWCWNDKTYLNPCPAEPRYTLPLQTVEVQISWLLKKPTDLDLHCLPLSMWIYINSLDQVIWLAENQKWMWHLNLFSRTRVNKLSAQLLSYLELCFVFLNQCVC